MSQTKCKTVKERRENVENAFILSKNAREKLEGKTVILIDDISTTGSTLSSAARTLKMAGVARIYAVCAARTPSRKEIGVKYIVIRPRNMKIIRIV